MLNRLAQHAGYEVCGAGSLSLSAGAAFYPQDGETAEQLLAEADRKMYAAKRAHYGCAGPTAPGADTVDDLICL
jgi:GGDEF domain-containing protein